MNPNSMLAGSRVVVPSNELFLDELAAAEASAATAGSSAAAAEGSAQSAEESATSSAAQVRLAQAQTSAATAQAVNAAASASAADTFANNASATEAAIQALIDGYPGSAGQTIPVATRAVMKAISAPVGSFYLYEAGREGTFVAVPWSSISADAANDTAEGYYIRSTATPTIGFRRVASVITPFHFGCVGDGATDDLPALQAFSNFVFSAPRNLYADFSGQFGTSGRLLIGPTVAPSPESTLTRYHVGGDLRLQALASTFECVRMRNMLGETWNGGAVIIGTGDPVWSSRTCGVGLAFENCGVMRFTGEIHAEFFWMAGVHTPTINNDSMYLGTVRCFYCGSGAPGYSLTSTFSGAANGGSEGSNTQTTILSGVSAFPSSAISTYEAIGAQQLHVMIAGKAYFVQAFDSGAGTVTIFPWLDPSIGSSGSFDWVIGGALALTTSDGNIINADHVQAIDCGVGLAMGALYGPRINSCNFASCGIGIALGRTPLSSCIGSSIDAYYCEGNAIDLLLVGEPVGATFHRINSSYQLDLAKVQVQQARYLGYSGGQTGEEAGWSGTGICFNGRMLDYEARAILNGEFATVTFADQRIPSRVLTRFLNAHTINLSVQGRGEFNRLFGYKGSNWVYVGTGANGAPTGTFTFNPPTLPIAGSVTANGSAIVTMPSTSGLVAGMPISGTGIGTGTTISAVNSSTQITLSAAATASGTVTLTVKGSINGTYSPATFSTFVGPAFFSINHRDAAQLQWAVWLVAGYGGR